MADKPTISEDIRELIQLLTEHGVEFVLVGGHAVAFYGYSRATMDVDFLVRPSAENSKRIMAALDAFGFGNAGIPPESFRSAGGLVTLGASPNEVDLMTSMSGESVDTIFVNAVEGHLGELPMKVIALEDLLSVKRTVNRPKDRLDIAELIALNKDSKDTDI